MDNPLLPATAPSPSNLEYVFNGTSLRVVQDDVGEPWFVLKDLSDALCYRDASNASRVLADDEKGTHAVSTLGGVQGVITVNESGLYRLIFGSRKDEAEDFRKWVYGEVLPSIRKTGSYDLTKKADSAIIKVRTATRGADVMEVEVPATGTATDLFQAAIGFEQRGAPLMLDWRPDTTPAFDSTAAVPFGNPYNPIRSTITIVLPERAVEYLTAEELAQKLGLPLLEVHESLERFGLLDRVSESWRLTDKGATYTRNHNCAETPIRWDPRVLPMLANYPTHTEAHQLAWARYQRDDSRYRDPSWHSHMAQEPLTADEVRELYLRQEAEDSEAPKHRRKAKKPRQPDCI